MQIGIYLYNEAEVLDFSGPFEVFSTANRLASRAQQTSVYLIAEHLAPVSARGGYKVLPHYSIDAHPQLDVVMIVGGMHLDELNNPKAIQWIKTVSQTATMVTSVCTGAFLLAEAGILTHHSVTTHWEDIADLRARYPNLTVEEGVRWVDEGNIVTSGGISAGIDMSLHLVSKLIDPELAVNTAKQMEFDWRPREE
ncbi:DJ-1/PfpI family protein [Thaumasiovibrio subtropicus]|uniref:DJ-1/PfpI family protein n=1 Tax=Thaumasiovibrio subtropicus TaxID=1891207 RepID=UPI000B3510D5|nr:DJ-1/PfpI family protein [Thaumasiovibrio subtropicus]